MTVTLPIGLDFGAISAPAGWSCTAPLLGFPGALSCLAADFPAGTAEFELTAKAYAGITSDTTLSLPIEVSSATADPDESDLSTVVDTQVLLPLVTSPPGTSVPGTPPASPVPAPASTKPGCISRRRFTVHLSKKQGSGRGTRIIKAVLLGAKGARLKSLKSTPTSVDVDLRGLSAQKVTVRVTTRPRHGNGTTSFTRSYLTCSAP